MSTHSETRSKAVKAVIFDYGEVLCHRPTNEEIAELAGLFNLRVDQLPALWERNRGPYDRGDLSPQIYWSAFAKDAGVELGPERLKQIHDLDIEMWTNVNSPMIDWAKQLRFSGMKVGVLSNMHPEMVAHCRKRFSWLDNFDFVTFSGEVRLIKPDPAIYEHTLRGLGVTASEALFLDDREINIRAAQKLGMYALRFESIEQLRNELAAADFPLLPAA